jgi:hypothetical protein
MARYSDEPGCVLHASTALFKSPQLAAVTAKRSPPATVQEVIIDIAGLESTSVDGV